MMRFDLQDIETAIDKAGTGIVPVACMINKELNLNNIDWFIVGGFVRDYVLDTLTNTKNISKDIDIVLSKNVDFKNNSNVLCQNKNSLGGTKIETEKFGTIDIFQQHVACPDTIIGDIFDFNCNSLYYSYKQKQVFASAYFYNFVGNNTLNFVRCIYIKSGIKTIYPEHVMISRALKFKIMFNEKYNMDIKLSNDILYVLYHMDKSMEQQMIEYTKIKVKSEQIQLKIFQEYERLRK